MANRLSEWTNTVQVGNSVYLMAELPAGCAQLVVTSPPYGNMRDYKGYQFNFRLMAWQLYRVLMPGGIVVWIVNDETEDQDESGESFRQALFFKKIGFKLYDTMIYEKSGFRYPRPRSYHGVFEYMFILSKGYPKTVNLICDRRNFNNDSNRTARKHSKREKDGSMTPRRAFIPREFGPRYNVWRVDAGKSTSTRDDFAYEHPAIFPESLARDHILSWSNPGDLVLDPMCGSGTTLKKAKELGRKFIGFDISVEYAEIAKQRVETANPPLFLMEVGQLPLPMGEENEVPQVQVG